MAKSKILYYPSRQVAYVVEKVKKGKKRVWSVSGDGSCEEVAIKDTKLPRDWRDGEVRVRETRKTKYPFKKVVSRLNRETELWSFLFAIKVCGDPALPLFERITLAEEVARSYEEHASLLPDSKKYEDEIKPFEGFAMEVMVMYYLGSLRNHVLQKTKNR